MAALSKHFGIDRLGLRFRFSLKRLFSLVAVAGVFAAVVSSIYRESPVPDEFEHNRRNLKQITIAIQHYQMTNGTLPYSERGSAAALFSLRHAITPTIFEGISRQGSTRRAKWDVQSKQLINADVVYLNVPNKRLESWRVILACPSDSGNYGSFATGDGIVRAWKGTIPVSDVLGCWVTLEGFLVVKKATFEKWCETHPMGGFKELRHIGEGPGPNDARLKDGSNVQYIYVDGRLDGCKITAANGTRIDEAVETDRYGRIVGISRSPDK